MLVILLSLAVGGLGFVRIGQLEYAKPGFEQLPVDHPLRKNSDPIHRLFQPVERVYIVLENSVEGRPFVLKSLGEIFARAIDDDRFAEHVLNRVEDMPRHRRFDSEPSTVLDILRAQDIPELERALNSEQVQLALSARFTAPSLVAAPGAESNSDPLGLFTGLEKRYLDELLPGKFRADGEYLFSDDGSLLTIIIEPPRPSSDISFSLRLNNFLEESWEVLLEQEPMAETVRLHLMGPHIDTARKARDVRASLWSAFGIAIFASFIIWIVAYRRSVILFSIVLPTVLAGLALAALSRELTATQITLLVALIVMVLHSCIFTHDRYIQEAVATPDRLKGALRRSLRGLSLPFLCSAVFLAFSALVGYLFDPGELVVSPLPILFGIAGLLFAAIWVSPAMLKIFVSKSRRRSISRHFSTFGARHIAWGALAYPRAWLALVILTTFGLIFGAAKTTITERREGVVSAVLVDPHIPTEDVSARVKMALAIPASEVQLATSGPELESALQANDKLYDILQRNKRELNIQEIESVARTLPAVAVQQKARADLLSSEILTIPYLSEHLAKETAQAGLQFEPIFAGFLDRIEALREAASQKPALRWSDVEELDVQRAHSEFLVAEDNEYLVLTRLWLEDAPPFSTSLGDWTRIGARVGAPLYVASTELEEAALNRQKIQISILLLFLEWLFLGLVLGFLARSFSWGVVPWIAALLWGLWCWGAIDILGIHITPAYLGPIHGLFLVFSLNLCFMVQRIWECTEERAPEEPEVAAFYRAVNSLGRPVTINLLVVLFLSLGLISLATSEFRDFGILGAVASGFGIMIILVVLPCACYLAETTAKRGDLVSFDDPRPLLRLRSADWAASDSKAVNSGPGGSTADA